jgi:hypothetical protein
MVTVVFRAMWHVWWHEMRVQFFWLDTGAHLPNYLPRSFSKYRQFWGGVLSRSSPVSPGDEPDAVPRTARLLGGQFPGQKRRDPRGLA